MKAVAAEQPDQLDSFHDGQTTAALRHDLFVNLEHLSLRRHYRCFGLHDFGYARLGANGVGCLDHCLTRNQPHQFATLYYGKMLLTGLTRQLKPGCHAVQRL